MSVRRAYPYTLPIFAIDPSDSPNGKGGLSFASGDVKISKDGATFVNATNNPSAVSGVTGAYKLELTAAEMDAVSVFVVFEKSGMEPIRVTLLTSADPSGTCVTDGSNTASTFKTDRTETTDNYWRDALIMWTSSSGLIHQVKRVSAYNGTTKFITVSSPFTGTPANGDRFVLVNK